LLYWYKCTNTDTRRLLYQHFFDTGKTGRLGAAGVSVAAVGERADNPFDLKTVQLDQNFKTNGYWPVHCLFTNG